MRLKRWLKRALVAILFSTLSYSLWLVGEREWAKWRGNRELTAAVAEADAQDPDWRWDALNAKRKFPPPDRNSAHLIPRINSLLAKDWGKEFNSPEYKSLHEQMPNIRYSPRLLELVRKDLAESAKAVTLARILKDFPEGNRLIELKPNPIETLLPDTQHTREITDILRWSILTRVDAGQYEGVGDDLIALLNCSRSLGDEPFLISQLVRMATRTVMVTTCERVIGQTQGSEDLKLLKLEVIQAALLADSAEPLLLHGLRGERASFEMLFDNLQNGTIDLNSIAGGKAESFSEAIIARPSWWLYRGRLPRDRAFLIGWFNLAVEAAKKSVEEQMELMDALPLPPIDDYHILSRLLLPAIGKVAAAHWRSTAEARCAVVGIACERFRLKRGQWPTELAELVPEFLKVIPRDPAGGEPLRMKSLEDGFLICSIGTFTNRNAPRTGLPEGIAAGFRLWDPSKRRQPAPPDPDPTPVGHN